MSQNAETFNALVLDRVGERVAATIREVRRDELPEGDVLVAVEYSSLNYKDGLAVTGKGQIVRDYPMAPGIDLAGTVVESASPTFASGDQVVLTGWGVGERHWGGYAQLARVKSDWLMPLPAGLNAQQAMGIGTAGLTAMLCLLALEERGVAPASGDVVVTGASGGVGSIAVALLAQTGYTVTASTGRADAHDYLHLLGASNVLDRGALAAPPDSARPLGKGLWAGAIDTVGGSTLAGLLRTLAYGGSVAACGLPGGAALHTTVLPFILRGVSLLGIDSVQCPAARRRAAWDRLARDLPPETLDRIVQVAPLRDVPALSEEILQGRVRGRIVIDVNSA